MTDYHIRPFKDEFNQVHIIFFYTGKLAEPILILRDYEFEKLIEEYKKHQEESK